MAYPTLADSEGIESANPYQQTLDKWIASDGSSRGRDLGAGNKLAFTLDYPAMSAADWTLLINHYNTIAELALANFAHTFSFSSAFTGTSHTVVYAASPVRILIRTGLYKATVKLTEI